MLHIVFSYILPSRLRNFNQSNLSPFIALPHYCSNDKIKKAEHAAGRLGLLRPAAFRPPLTKGLALSGHLFAKKK